MSIEVNTKEYVPSKVAPEQVGYAGPAHTASVKDFLSLGPTAAKPTSVFSGVVRSDTKLTRTLTLTSALTPTGEAIFEVKTSIPVGTADADIVTLADDMAALIGSADFLASLQKSKVFFPDTLV